MGDGDSTWGKEYFGQVVAKTQLLSSKRTEQPPLDSKLPGLPIPAKPPTASISRQVTRYVLASPSDSGSQTSGILEQADPPDHFLWMTGTLMLLGKEKCILLCITLDQDRHPLFSFSSRLWPFLYLSNWSVIDTMGMENWFRTYPGWWAGEYGSNLRIANKRFPWSRSRFSVFPAFSKNLPPMQNRYPWNQWQEIIGTATLQRLYCTMRR